MLTRAFEGKVNRLFFDSKENKKLEERHEFGREKGKVPKEIFTASANMAERPSPSPSPTPVLDTFLEAIVYTPSPYSGEEVFRHVKCSDIAPESAEHFLACLRNLTVVDRLKEVSLKYRDAGEGSIRSFVFARIGLGECTAGTNFVKIKVE